MNYDDEMTEWLETVRQRLVPKMEASTIVASLVSGKTDPKFAIELGYSIMLDKPLVAIVMPGVKLPTKLAIVADAIMEYTEDPALMAERTAEALRIAGLGDRVKYFKRKDNP